VAGGSTWKRRLLSLARYGLLAAVVVGVISVMATAGAGSWWRPVGAIGFGLATLCALFGALAAVGAVFTAPWVGAGSLQGLLLVLVNGFIGLVGYVFAAMSIAGGRGRQLRRFGRVLLPGLRANDEWSRGAAPLAVSPVPRDGLAAQWRENAKTEHASVAAFARLTLDLMALGAPPELVAEANRDGLDEIRHAQACLALAASIDGRHESPAPFPEAQTARTLPRTRLLALAQLAVDSLVDGALHEGVSARVIARLARTAGPPEIRAMLAQLAADEGRHSAHGWHVVDWCVEQGGEPVLHALRGAVRALPRTMHSAVAAGAADGSWETWGIPGRQLEADEYAKTLAHVISRVESFRGRQSAPLAA
jgi:hypothetical protein